MDDELHSTREGLASNLSTIARLFMAIIAVTLFLQLVSTAATVLQETIHALITIIRILVIWPARILIKVLCVPITIFRLVIAVLVCPLARGVMAFFKLFGLSNSRQGREKPGGGGDATLLGTSRQQANMACIQNIGMAGRWGHGWQVHILLSDRRDGGGQNIGIVWGGMSGAGAWEAATLEGDGLVAQGSLARCSITAWGESGRTQEGRGS